jgi:hypothetical protein
MPLSLFEMIFYIIINYLADMWQCSIEEDVI